MKGGRWSLLAYLGIAFLNCSCDSAQERHSLTKEKMEGITVDHREWKESQLAHRVEEITVRPEKEKMK